MRSWKYIRWWQEEATPYQKHLMRNIQSRRRFTRWAVRRNHWWGILTDCILASLIVLGLVEVLMYLLYLIGKWIGY